jgi:hypothetical protein
MIKTCAKCGEEFEYRVYQGSGPRKYCSRKCGYSGFNDTETERLLTPEQREEIRQRFDKQDNQQRMEIEFSGIPTGLNPPATPGRHFVSVTEAEIQMRLNYLRDGGK